MACPKTKLIKATATCPNLAPGLVKLFLAEQKWLDTVPAPEDYYTNNSLKPLTITGDITLDTTTYPDAKWTEWDIQPNKNGYEPVSLGETGARYWQTSIPFMIAGLDPAIDQAVDWALNAKLVAVGQLRSGKRIFIGDKTNFLEMTQGNGNSGKATGDFVGWDLILQLPAHNILSPYYEGALTPVDAL